jgi:general secretion pathway protein G
MKHRKGEEGLPLQGVWLETFMRFARFFGIPALGMWLFVAMMPSSFRTPRGRVAAAKVQINDFKTALELYRLDHGGKAPTTRQGLRALLRPPRGKSDPRWKGPYLNDLTSVPLDPWRHPYVYASPGPNGASYLVLSYGADGKAGGSGEDEDLSSLKR